jgi:hypothetical protein
MAIPCPLLTKFTAPRRDTIAISSPILAKGPTKSESESTDDSDSWEAMGLIVDGWTVGWDKSTKMCVRRKGRGKFRFGKGGLVTWDEFGERDGVVD